MLVFELIYPGTWLDLPDRERAHQLELLLHLLETHYVDAAVALNLFLDAQAQVRTRMLTTREEWERDAERRRHLTEQLERRLAADRPQTAVDPRSYNELSERAEIEMKHERWASGTPPREYIMRTPFLHARSFVYALDNIGKMLDALSKEPGVPPEVAAQRDSFYAAFSSLIGVRNTAHHPEDRGRGLGKGGKPLDLKPIDNEMVKAPGGGVLVLDSLNGNNYGCTIADGHYGQVEVSAQSAQVAQQCIQGVLNAFRWKGPHRCTPT